MCFYFRASCFRTISGYTMKSSGHRISACLLALLVGFLTLLFIGSCGGGGSRAPQLTGTITTSISDPPVCAESEGGPFSHVWVTITEVRAHISSDAGPNDSGWVDLINLGSIPKQIDLLSLASTTCILTQLGSTSGLPPGKYQQIRFHLLANDATGVTVMPENHCGIGPGTGPFNCVLLSGDTATQTLQLTSEAQTGLKIPPGQISGGGISLKPGQSADININFDACSSVVGRGPGGFLLKPTLHAGEVSLNSNSISGNVVVTGTTTAIPGAIVLLEQPDSNHVDRVFMRMSTVTGTDGSFIFCPLPAGNYDVVVAASRTPVGGVTTTYNATITFSVPLGTALTNLPLIAEGGANTPAAITATATTAGSGAKSAEVTLSALQEATPTSGPTLQVTIPVFGAITQPPMVTTTAAISCTVVVDCVTDTLLVPGSNPQFGTFSSSGFTYTAPTAGDASYKVEAQACGSTLLSGPLTVGPGGSVTVSTTFAFTGCP